MIASWHSLVLDEAITKRHSTRMFLPQQVPRALVDESRRPGPTCAVEFQHLAVAYGDRVAGPPRDRHVAPRCSTQPGAWPPNISPLPESFQHFRRELGAQVYGAMGIAPEDTAKHAAAVLRNWEFFRAPLIGIVCMHRDLGPADALSAGMQTLLLAFTERGLGTCIEVSVAGYPQIVRVQLAVPAELLILCGLAVGYPDPDFPAYRLHVSREPIDKNVAFLDR